MIILYLSQPFIILALLIFAKRDDLKYISDTRGMNGGICIKLKNLDFKKLSATPQKSASSEKTKTEEDLELDFEEEFVPETIFDSFKKELGSKTIDTDETNKKLSMICESVLAKPRAKRSAPAKRARTEGKIRLELERSVMSCTKLSEKYIQDIISELDERKKKLASRKSELRSDFRDWKSREKDLLDSQLEELEKKQKQFTKLEDENKKLKKELGVTKSESGKREKELDAKRTRLNKLEKDLEKKAKDHEAKSEKFQERLKDIDNQSKKLNAQRTRLLSTQRKFAKYVYEFEEVVKKDRIRKLKTGSSSEREVGDEDLNSEWEAIHAEEKRLEGFRNELMGIKNKFMSRISSERNELAAERKALAKEWEKVKKIRKNLKATMPELETRLRNLFEVESKSKLKRFIKGRQAKFEAKIAALEKKMLNEINELMSSQTAGETKELVKEWSRIHAEEEKLGKIRTEMLAGRKQIIDNYGKQRDELNQERTKLEQKWKKLCKI